MKGTKATHTQKTKSQIFWQKRIKKGFLQGRESTLEMGLTLTVALNAHLMPIGHCEQVKATSGWMDKYCSVLWSHLHQACCWCLSRREGLRELGGGRDFGPGNGCIFNSRESEGSGVRRSSCIIDRTMDAETLKARVAHTHKDEDLRSSRTCHSANTCPCVDPVHWV